MCIKELVQTNIFFVAIHRAPEKVGKWAQVDEANKLVKTFCATNNKLGNVEVNPALFVKQRKRTWNYVCLINCIFRNRGRSSSLRSSNRF